MGPRKYLLIVALVLDVAYMVNHVEAADCSTVTCLNGGTCNNFTDSPPCICPLPYIAPYCIAAADYCETRHPDKGITELLVCQNNGSCTMIYTDPYFNCSCPAGFFGIRCNLTQTGEPESLSETIVIIVLVSVLLLMTVVTCCLIIFCIVRRQRKNRKKCQEVNESHGSTEGQQSKTESNHVAGQDCSTHTADPDADPTPIKRDASLVDQKCTEAAGEDVDCTPPGGNPSAEGHKGSDEADQTDQGKPSNDNKPNLGIDDLQQNQIDSPNGQEDESDTIERIDVLEVNGSEAVKLTDSETKPTKIFDF